MLEYIFLVIGALLIFPILYYLVSKGKAGKKVAVMAGAGFFIALAGIYLQEHFAFYYVALGMLSLAFAAGVLIDRRTGGQVATADTAQSFTEPIRLGRDAETAAGMAVDESSRGSVATAEDGLAEEDIVQPVDPLMKNKEIGLPSSADLIHSTQPNGMTNTENPEVPAKPNHDNGILGSEDFIEPEETETAEDPARRENRQDQDIAGPDVDLDFWLEGRQPEVEDLRVEMNPAPEDVVRDYNPFELLEEDDYIVKEEEDGKQ